MSQMGHGAGRGLAGIGCLAALLAMLCAAPPTRAASAVVMQTYTDPGKHFVIQYPLGWHVKREANGYTTFYVDDPLEGTALAVWVPPMAWKGEVDASAIMKAFLQSKLKTDPDLKVVGRQRQIDAQSTVAEVALTWTNPHKVPMRGYGEVNAKEMAGKGATLFGFEGYQASASSFDGVEPTFGRMLKSFTPQ